jgi:DNA repair protein RadC
MPEKPRDYNRRSNQELLELLLRSGDRAEQILKQVPLDKLDQAHRQELRLTPKAYERLQASIEIGRRIQESKTSFRAIIKISSSSDAIAYCQRHFARLVSDCLQEEFHIVTLDTKNQIISTHQITIGTLDASLVHPREVFRAAIKDAASSIILAHNHPSGDPTPSREDIAVTDRLCEVGKTIGIDVLDHIVMGKERCVSLQEYR